MNAPASSIPILLTVLALFIGWKLPDEGSTGVGRLGIWFVAVMFCVVVWVIYFLWEAL